ncbi:hypothetical protein [uncultured Tateyamaria sp.]|uniref:hypothetical protein n=1 Tax=uncultured Tateyamaria sp. TaxID=455651 RepID=UPI0026026386|nr:hypothetical protein [uncultured Tateyamaria sp.]
MMRSAMACVMLLALAACGDPLRGIERVSEGATLPAEPGNNALPSEEELAREGSILGDFLDGTETDVAEGAAQSARPLPTADVSETGPVAAAQAQTAPQEQATQTPRTSGGLLGWLRGAAQNDTQAQADVVPVAAAPQDPETILAKAEDAPAAQSPDLVEPQKRRGLFGRPRAFAPGSADIIDVAPGMTVPFGQIARACAANPKKTATLVDKAAGKGRGYALYDTVPDSTGPRTFYVTGFSDNCPRQFTAALALFGEPAFHEQLRYGLPADEYPYSTTDKAYETLKRRICNVGRTKPCGTRIDRLSRNTTFISAYENFTDNARWADMLLHDGAVLATALKTP